MVVQTYFSLSPLNIQLHSHIFHFSESIYRAA
jgi:hypothetical protein